MWEGCALKGQESAHILPQKEERRTEESWVLGVGGQLYKYSKQHARTVLKRISLPQTCICQCAFISFHTLMERS